MKRSVVQVYPGPLKLRDFEGPIPAVCSRSSAATCVAMGRRHSSTWVPRSELLCCLPPIRPLLSRKGQPLRQGLAKGRGEQR